MTVEALLDSIRQLHQDVLGQLLIGCYVHGSLALGCFQWNRSDIDFLTLVHAQPSPAQKEALIAGLLRLELSAPPKGLETSVLCQDACMPFQYPTPFVLHYSRMHRPQATRDLTGYCKAMHGVDKDLAAHITVTRQSGLVLCGKPIHEVFAAVPPACYLDSILADIGPGATLDSDPAYTLLNLCRTWAYLDDGLVRSKLQGGHWALSRLSKDQSECIRAALAHYEGRCATFPPRHALQSCAAWLLTQVRKNLPVYTSP